MFSELYPVRQPDHPRKLGEAVSPGRQGTGLDKREDARELGPGVGVGVGDKEQQDQELEGGGVTGDSPLAPPNSLAIWLIPKGAGEFVLFAFFLWEEKQRKVKSLGSAGSALERLSPPGLARCPGSWTPFCTISTVG